MVAVWYLNEFPYENELNAAAAVGKKKEFLRLRFVSVVGQATDLLSYESASYLSLTIFFPTGFAFELGLFCLLP
jgi:hypothetical protein